MPRAARSATLIIAPFRRPTFRKALSPLYPVEEPWDAAPLVIAGAMVGAGFDVRYLPLQNIFDGFDEVRDAPALKEILTAQDIEAVVFASDSNIASRSTAAVYGVRCIAAMLAELRPRPILTATGRLATAAGDRLLREVPALDFVVVGEAEATISRAVDKCLRGGPSALADEPSVLTRSKIVEPDAAIVPALVEDLSTLPLPAWELVPPAIDLHRRHHPGWHHPVPFSLRTSIGCIYQCSFCAGIPNWRNYRTKSAARVGSELDGFRALSAADARLSFLEDEIFTLDEAHVEAMSTLFVERGVRVDGVYTHARLLTPSSAQALSTMTDRVFIGMDNPDDGALLRMGKGQTVAHVMEAVEVARAEGLSVHLEWLLGSPEDTVESLVSSLVAIFNLLATGAVASVNTYVYCPHPGTAYAEDLSTGVGDLAEFDDIQESGGFPVRQTPELTRNQIFTAYLLSQLVVSELRPSGRHPWTKDVLSPNRKELERLLQRVGGDRE